MLVSLPILNQESKDTIKAMALTLQKEIKTFNLSIQRNFQLFWKLEDEKNKLKAGEERRKKI